MATITRADPAGFRAALLAEPPAERDAWVDAAFGLGDLPADGPDLPEGCVPYLPCAAATLLRAVDGARVGPSDVFVDVGSGLGRAAAFVRLLTGATVVGVEIQASLVAAARELATRLELSGLSFLRGDASEMMAQVDAGSVFFLYCPFSGDRLAKLLAVLEAAARTRTIQVCCVDLALPPCPWLQRVAASDELDVYRSRL